MAAHASNQEEDTDHTSEHATTPPSVNLTPLLYVAVGVIVAAGLGGLITLIYNYTPLKKWLEPKKWADQAHSYCVCICVDHLSHVEAVHVMDSRNIAL